MINGHWDDLRIAYQVAVSGSLTQAAVTLNINHTTVLRHVNRLEQSLGCKLFIRHQRGYKLTDAGQHLLLDIPTIDTLIRQFNINVNANKQRVEGILKITTLPEYSSFLHPVLKKSQRLYPELRIQVDASDTITSLNTGEAHIAIRAGRLPKEVDIIAKKLFNIRFSYYAADSYVSQRGLPRTHSDYANHLWVMPRDKKQHIPIIRTVIQHLSPCSIIYQSNNFADIQSAIEEGIGIGPIDESKAKNIQNITRVKNIQDLNDNALWFAYHRDLREDIKIKALLDLIFDANETIETNTNTERK